MILFVIVFGVYSIFTVHFFEPLAGAGFGLQSHKLFHLLVCLKTRITAIVFSFFNGS
jgi:hypothetical protein